MPRKPKNPYEPGPEQLGQVGYHSLRTIRRIERQEHVLKRIREGLSASEAARELGMNPNAVSTWRQQYPEFAKRLDAARAEALNRPKARKPNYAEAKLYSETTADFSTFRKDYFGHDTAPHHLLLIETIERSKPGEISLILGFPGMGKTTCLVDYVNYKLALDPNQRIAYISEGQNLARKTLGQIQSRMTDDTRFAKYISTFGPFRQPVGTGQKKYIGRETGNPWTADWIKVFKATHDEKDFSVEALGATSSIYGGRFDRMIYDDLQSVKTLNLTDRILTWLRQDALTRPGHNDGGHVIIGSRVGVGDLYDTMIQEDMIANSVKIPALTQWVDRDEHYIKKNGKILVNPNCPAQPTWDAWTLYTLAQRRDLVKEEIWTRTYMQSDHVSSEATFTEPMLDSAKDRTHRKGESFGTRTIITVDPALGKGICCFTVLGLDPEKIMVREQYTRTGFQTYDDIYTNIDSLCARYRPTHVVIEDNAFQQGLINSPQLIALRGKYGFTISSHKTARNKHDPVYGVAMMASSFTDGEIGIPWAGPDETTMFGPLLDELRRWVPSKRGGQLVQDRVVGLWFGWKFWQEIRDTQLRSSRMPRRDTPSWMRRGSRGAA